MCDLEFISADADEPALLERLRHWAAEQQQILTMAVCLDSDSRSLSCALSMLSKIEEFGVPILVRMSEEAGLATLLENSAANHDRLRRVHVFGLTHRTCSRESLLSEDLDRLAMATHRRVVQRRSQQKRPADDSSASWDELEYDFQDSNRQQADHIAVKLRAIGCYSGPPDPDKPTVDAIDDTDEIERLARMEHARWNAERFLAGWTYAAGEKDLKKKTSPYLVPWEQLADDLKDYDRQPIRNIPGLLKMIGQRVYRKSP